MASLKEIKERIGSVKSTRKITSAMKMVSAAKLHKSQAAITGMLPYSKALNHVMENLLNGEGEMSFALAEKREVKRLAIVVFSSNSSLCGAFNTNVARELNRTLQNYKQLDADDVEIYAVGRKIADMVRKSGHKLTGTYEELADKPEYHKIAELAGRFMDMFHDGKVDRVELIFHHFKSAGSQTLVNEDLLPLALSVSDRKQQTDYILEPSREDILDTLIPKAIKLKLYTALLDSNASEHAARVIAMQAATDNADDLIGELTIDYNKSRQQAITSELLDIVGGTMN